MSNMSYCRFENTAGDLSDCLEALENEGLDTLSRSEKLAAKQLIALCGRIVDWAEDEGALGEGNNSEEEGE
jgi:hypothetical protein